MKWISQVEKEYGNADCELNEENCYFIVSVKSFTLNEQKFGEFSSPTLQIHIESKEGDDPHIHICKKNGKRENIILRVCLCKAEYFREKDDKRNTLNCQERKALDAFFKKPRHSGGTMWDLAMDLWIALNPSCKKNLDGVRQPNYQTIDEPK